MKSLSIIGSTGSIGTQTLEVVKAAPEDFRVVALAARRSVDLLVEQALAFKPSVVALLDTEELPQLRERLPGFRVVGGMEGVCEAAALAEANLVVSTFVGMAGLQPTLAALEAGHQVALANKEALVVGGELVTRAARHPLLPIDSEHSAIFQCLNGEEMRAVSKIILTASGGPFRQRPTAELASMRASDALKHPTWNMGSKITIDSSTLMNKGFEVLEAQHLFGVGLDKVEVWVHPQSIVHSLVEFVDGSVMAQLGPPDMRTPIQYCLGYPERRGPAWSRLALEHMKSLTFEEPRYEDFPCLRLAYAAGCTGGTMPAVLNAANEVAVEHFLHDRIGFLDIPRLISETMEAHEHRSNPHLADLLEADRWARTHAEGLSRRRAQV